MKAPIPSSTDINTICVRPEHESFDVTFADLKGKDRRVGRSAGTREHQQLGAGTHKAKGTHDGRFLSH
jgi:hypothetical protein